MATGKNKEQFEKWLIEKYFHNLHFNNINDVIGFNNLPFEMQKGVYLAYYDSLGMKVYTMGSISDTRQWSWSIWMDGDFEELIEEYNFNTRPEAHKEAFKKANELLNEKLK